MGACVCVLERASFKYVDQGFPTWGLMMKLQNVCETVIEMLMKN